MIVEAGSRLALGASAEGEAEQDRRDRTGVSRS
jgi:hypothetical protein